MTKKKLLIPLLFLLVFASLSSQTQLQDPSTKHSEQNLITEGALFENIDFENQNTFYCDSENLYTHADPDIASGGGEGGGGLVCNDKQIKYVRLNLHYMLRESVNSPGNFTETNNGFGSSPDVCYTGYDYARDLLEALNWSMARNFEPGHSVPGFPNHYDKFPPKRVKFVMDGVYFHRDNNFSDYEGDNAPDANMHYNIYGENQETVYNVYLTSWAVNGTSSAKVLTGLPRPSMVVNKAWFYYVTNNPYFSQHAIADRIVHELGHFWGLCHSFFPGNICDDINTEANCDGNPSPLMTCGNGNPTDDDNPDIGCNAWTSGDNNLMGYNPHATNITVCQLDLIHDALEGSQSTFVSSCCDEWDFEESIDPNVSPSRNTLITEDCDPDFCIIPDIIPTVEPNGTNCKVCFRVENDATPSTECVEWQLSLFTNSDTETPYNIITGSGLEICAEIPNSHFFELCMVFCGYDDEEVETCWSRQRCNTVDEVRDVRFTFMDEDENEGNIIPACSDVFIDASATTLCDATTNSHYYSLWEVVDDEEIFLAWTNSMPGIPVNPTNISEVFQTYTLNNSNSDSVEPIIFEYGKTYILQLGVRYNKCSIIKTRHEFSIEDKFIDFHFEDIDGNEQTVFDLCEDIWMDASASDEPIDYHRYTLFELDGSQELFRFWIPNSEGAPANPTNLSNIFQVPNLLDADGDPLESFEFECGKTYRLQLAMHCEGRPEVKQLKDFSIVCKEDCEPCPSLIPSFQFGINKLGECKITFTASQGLRACYDWQVTSVLSDGTIDVTPIEGPASICVDAAPLQSIEVCVTTCDNDCDYFEDCLVLTEEMITQGCDDLAGNEDEDAFNSDIVLFPNPVIDQITVSATDGNLEEIYILDINGFLQKKYQLASVESQQIDIGFLESGNYKIMVRTSNNVIIAKGFVKL